MAGKRGFPAGPYQGALVGVGYVVLEAIGLAPPPFALTEDGLGESAAIIASDALLLAVAALFGWLGAQRPSSSSGRDRGR